MFHLNALQRSSLEHLEITKLPSHRVDVDDMIIASLNDCIEIVRGFQAKEDTVRSGNDTAQVNSYSHALFSMMDHESFNGGGAMNGYGDSGHYLRKNSIVFTNLQEGLEPNLVVYSHFYMRIITKGGETSNGELSIAHHVGHWKIDNPHNPFWKNVSPIGRPTVLTFDFPKLPNIEAIKNSKSVSCLYQNFSKSPPTKNEIRESVDLFTKPKETPRRMIDLRYCIL